MSFCPQCGIEDISGAAFCVQCGTALPKVPESPVIPPILPAVSTSPAIPPIAVPPATQPPISTVIATPPETQEQASSGELNQAIKAAEGADHPVVPRFVPPTTSFKVRLILACTIGFGLVAFG